MCHEISGLQDAVTAAKANTKEAAVASGASASLLDSALEEGTQ
jgi:hypothetical protein